jgi:hypothetical protein
LAGLWFGAAISNTSHSNRFYHCQKSAAHR